MGGMIEFNSRGRVKEYTVTIAYAGFDSQDDKRDSFEEPEVFEVHIDAVTNVQAIVQAVSVVNMRRAEIMTDYMTQHPLIDGNGKDKTYTVDEIEEIRQSSEDQGVFRSWLSIEPTTIQCHLTKDTDNLFDMTRNNIDYITSGDKIADDVQDYLKGSEE